MRRITVIGMVILGLVALPLMAAAAPPAKVDICHFTGDGESHTIEVSEKALQAHLDHGDTEGACDDVAPTTEPPVLTAAFTVGDSQCEGMFYCWVDVDASTSVGDPTGYVWLGTSLDFSTQVGAVGVTARIAGLYPGNNVIRLDITDAGGNTAFTETNIFLTFP